MWCAECRRSTATTPTKLVYCWNLLLVLVYEDIPIFADVANSELRVLK